MPKKRTKGFTLIEMIVASIIGAFVAFVAIGTLKAISVNSAVVDDTISVTGEIKFATDMMKKDLINLFRSSRLSHMKFIGTFEDREGEVFILTFYTVSRSKARIYQPESDVYEVEYYLDRTKDKSVLMRRFWPYPDPNSEPGGILAAIAEGIDIFMVKFYDGELWLSEWTEDMESLPKMVEVVLGSLKENSEDVITESFIVNFSKSTGEELGTLQEGEGEEGTESEADGTSSQESNP